MLFILRKSGRDVHSASLTVPFFLYQINDKNTRSFKQIPNDNYIFDRIPNTGVIVECGFLSNAEEELMLQNDSYQSKLAMLIIGGYTNYKYNR